MILEGDIQLLAPERLTDDPDGGGRMTGNAVVDGQANNLFDDISSWDRTHGAVSLRKPFMAVLSDNTDAYFDAHTTIDEGPSDPSVSALLFATGDWADERADARDFVERYVTAGPLSPWFLYDVQIEGQRSLLLFGRVGVALPEVGDVLYLVEDEGEPAAFSQYVRVTAVESEVRTFTDASGEFQREIITVELSDALRATYHGAAISRLDDLAPDAACRTTRVADAARYYGVQPLAQAASTGALQIALADVYGQLVPAARSEAPVADYPAGGDVTQEVTSGPETFRIAGPAHTDRVDVTLGNRAYTYVHSCSPVPAPGTLRVDYRALGKWYRLDDDGSGQLSGSGGGAGVVNFDTGTVSVTLGALPDVGSSIIYTWGSRVHYVDRAGTAEAEMPVLQYALGEPVVPGTLTVTWLRDEVEYQATAAVDGTISGDGLEGHLVAATGDVYLQWTQLPDYDSQAQFDYDTAVVQSATVDTCSPTYPADGEVAFTLPSGLPAKPGSVAVHWTVTRWTATAGTRLVPKYTYIPRADHSGYLDGVITGYRQVAAPQYDTRQVDQAVIDDSAGALGAGGSVDYTTGACRLVYATPYQRQRWSGALGAWVTQDADSSLYGGIASMTVEWVEDGAAPTTKSVTVPIPALVVTFLPLLTDRLVPGTVRFQLGGVAYSDRAGLGTLYWDDGTIAGSIDYERRAATITRHAGGAALTVTSLVSVYGDWHAYAYTTRTPGSPLQPGGTTVNATALDGSGLTEVCDLNGLIASATAAGQVEQAMGIVTLRFGALVLDSSLTPEQKAEDWYDPADIDENGYIWLPTFTYPNTVRLNTVVYTYLPLDAEILGLDPVRLPSDGRVPIYRPGDVAVIHHTGEIAIASPAQGQVIDCGRQRLARVRIEDAAGTKLDEAAGDYTPDLDAGTVTLGDVSAYTAPLTLSHRVEDMRLVADVQIDGTLTLTLPLTHDFPEEETLVSGAQYLGDKRARYAGLFSQETWTGDWSDALVGDSPEAQYNDVLYPLTVTNRGCAQERWALVFFNSTQFNVIGEIAGQIATGSTGADLAPLNPATGVPYFTLSAAGWGSGWAAGNLLRFNTYGANHPLWLARTVAPGPAGGDDQIRIENRGDVNA